MIPRLTTTRPDDDMRWGCHSCGAKLSLGVIRSEHDEDGYPIRQRRCSNCKAVFATIEKPFPLVQFHARAESITQRTKRILRERKSQCKRCAFIYGENTKQATYKYGKFSKHVELETHLAVLTTQPNNRTRKRERDRRYRDYWRKRGIDIATATSGHALNDDLYQIPPQE